MKRICRIALVFIMLLITLASCKKEPGGLSQGITNSISTDEIPVSGNDEDSPRFDRLPFIGDEVYFTMGETYPTNWPWHWPDYILYQPNMEIPSGEITVMVGNTASRMFHETIIKFFNERHPGVTVNLIEYAAQEDLLTALSGGNVPDIVDVGGQHFFEFTKYNFFTDLNIFINGDGILKREDFYENILRELEVDGSLYYLVPYIKYDFVKIENTGYLSLPEYFKAKDTLSIDEMITIYEVMAKGVEELLPFVYSNQLMYASSYFTFNSDMYVDLKERFTRFSPDYTEMLDRLKPLEPDHTGSKYKGEMFRSIKSLFYVFPYDYTRLLDYLPNTMGMLLNRLQQARIEIYENANIDGADNHIGRWVLDGSARGDAFGAGSSVLSIPADTRNRELAWEYIKFTLMRGPEHRKLSNDAWPPHFWGHSIHRPSFFAQMYNELTQLYVLNTGRQLPTSTYDALVDAADWIDARNKTVHTFNAATGADMAKATRLFADVKSGIITSDGAADSLDAYFKEVFK